MADKVITGLRVHPFVWAKLVHMVRQGKDEMSGFGRTERGHPNVLVDFNVLDQEVTAASTEIDDQAVVDYQYEMVQKGYEPRDYMRIWIHNHPMTSTKPTPSGGDENILEQYFGEADWVVVIIMNKTCEVDKTYCNLRMNAPFKLQTDIPFIIDYSLLLEQEVLDGWTKEFEDRVRSKHVGFQGGQTYQYGTAQTNTTPTTLTRTGAGQGYDRPASYAYRGTVPPTGIHGGPHGRFCNNRWVRSGEVMTPGNIVVTKEVWDTMQEGKAAKEDDTKEEEGEKTEKIFGHTPSANDDDITIDTGGGILVKKDGETLRQLVASGRAEDDDEVDLSDFGICENMIDKTGFGLIVPVWVVKAAIDDEIDPADIQDYFMYAEGVYDFDTCNSVLLSPKEEKHLRNKKYTLIVCQEKRIIKKNSE